MKQELQNLGWRFFILWIVAVLSAALDLWTTYYCLEHAGMEEGNPVARYLLEHKGPLSLFYGKVVALSVLALVYGLVTAAYQFKQTRIVAKVAFPVAVAFTVLGVIVVFNNLYWLYRWWQDGI
jgi:hypothetical protein